MKPWPRLTLVVMTVGGGFAGFAATLQALFDSSGVSSLNRMVMLAFAGLYAFVLASGLLYVWDANRTGPLLVALALQVPVLSSPVVAYQVAAGLGVFASFGDLGEKKVGFHFDWLLGGRWSFFLFGHNPLRLGINIAALTMFLWLLWTAFPTRQAATVDSAIETGT